MLPHSRSSLSLALATAVSLAATAAFAAPQRVVGRAASAPAVSAPGSAAEPMGNWHADVWEDVMESTTITETPGYRMATKTDGYYGTGSFNAVMPTLVDLDGLKLTYSESTDGKTIVSLRNVALHASPNETDGRCVYAPAGELTVRVCRKLEEGLTTVSISRQSQDVTFHSEETGKPNVDTHEVTGPQTRLGLTVAMDVELTDGRSIWSASPSMVLVPTERSADEPRCTTTAAGQTCTHNTLHGIAKQGFASSDAQ